MTSATAPSPRPARRAVDRRDELADVVLDLTAARGLDAVSVREVATAAGVSIGTVQHHFGTKDALLLAAFERMVQSTRDRVAAVSTAGTQAARIARVLGQLLPLDDQRDREARVYLAFAARAASTPTLAAVQSALLSELRAELAAVLGGRAAVERATLLLALVDGLALQQVSSAVPLDAGTLRRVLARAVDAVL
ncbi:TetR family transcriptional regulator C-terminal domain-containing protein [Nakamurella sp. A5-74]|uniref:TetR family transcriptional regulator C-terminal domain-containing protein n=1 Tax=Nakamurella sp. A5-74 TaxID=3158264 RepID=A0AAU8DVL9_9ACTN